MHTSKPITIFHRSGTLASPFLTEVKRTARFYVARRWARNHPAAHVYVRVEVPDSTPLWCGFEPLYGVPNVAWVKLASKDLERLPELLESS